MIHYNNFNSAQAAGQGQRSLPAGGYIAQIQMAVYTESRNGSPMLEVRLDIADGEYKGIFASKVQTAGTWANAGTYRLTLPTDPNAPADDWRLQRLKGFITAVEESNPSYKWRDDERTLRGQFVGILYRDEEYIGTDGKKHISAKPAFFCSVQRIRSGQFSIPRPKILTETAVNTPQTYSSVPQDEFMPVETAISGDKDLPF